MSPFVFNSIAALLLLGEEKKTALSAIYHLLLLNGYTILDKIHCINQEMV